MRQAPTARAKAGSHCATVADRIDDVLHTWGAALHGCECTRCTVSDVEKRPYAATVTEQGKPSLQHIVNARRHSHVRIVAHACFRRFVL